MRTRYSESRRVLSFGEYVELFDKAPQALSRDASRYLRDIFDHYGQDKRRRPWGTETRFLLFDLPFAEPHERLVGHEAVQMEVYRALSNFAREGRVNRLLLLHGPNGSAKSTFAACLALALEHYSSLPEGALYRFNWVFPTRGTERGTIGFAGGKGRETVADASGSYAYLEDEQVDARLGCELRDHPLLLIPRRERREFLETAYRAAGTSSAPPKWLWDGGLCAKCRQVFEALLVANQGDFLKVLRHVQVERYFVSRRYRTGAVTLGPQLSVDAEERQVTMDRTITALPSTLQTVTLFEPHGELVDASGGLIEFSDLLKRPLDAFKYLLLTIESGDVQLAHSILHLNTVMIASSNEIHLAAFKEHPEFNSFRGRIELVRTPYLLDYRDEQQIYDLQIRPQVSRHVAPHAILLASLWAVLTRMRKPVVERHGKVLGALVAELGPLEKAELYSSGKIPPRLSHEHAKELRVGIAAIYRESEAYPNYEGRLGASPREIRTLLLDSSQHADFDCLSPLAVFGEIDELCKLSGEYEFLKQETLPGGYHDARGFVALLRERYLDLSEEELRSASGIVAETQYMDLFELYISHVSHWVKREKLLNRVTGTYEDPDEELMRRIERTIDAGPSADDFRKNIIPVVAAWAIERPGQKIDFAAIFPAYIQKVKEHTFRERREQVARLARDIVTHVSTPEASLETQAREHVVRTLAQMRERFGYCDRCARDAAGALLSSRYRDLL
ncbi:MAG: serine protein kinase PrkA [Deltaproteobacteria bacterium]|nr:serine protein kinase PrkA [Deltaproteobacteria bacterium]